MTVEQLIARLAELEPALRVIMPREEDLDFCEVSSAFVDTVLIKGDLIQLSDEREAGWVKVVRLYGPEPD